MTSSYDICAIFISIILIVYLVKFRSIRNYQNTIFVMLLIDNAITAIAETIESMLILNRSIRYIATEVYFLSHILVIPLLFIYIMSLVVNWYSINNIWRYLILAPSFASIVLVLINPLVDFVFTYNDSGYYERGLGVYLIYAFAMFYFLLIVFILLRYRDIMSIVQKGVIVSSLFIIIGSAVEQILNPDIRIEVFAISFSTLVVVCGLGNTYNQVEPETNLFSRNTFLEVVNHNFLIHRPFRIIELVFTNLESINILGDDMGNRAIMAISEFISEETTKATLFRYEESAMILEIENHDESYANEIINLIIERVKKPIEIDDLEVLLNVRIINLQCPEDVKTDSSLCAILHEAIISDSEKMVQEVKDFNIGKIERKNKIENVLTKAVNEKGIELSYTPIYSFTKNKIIGAKAVSRFLDSEIGYVTEEEIIRYSEKTGNINLLVEGIFDKIVDFLSSEDVMESGIEFICVNISSVLLFKDEYMNRLLHKIREKNIDNQKIMFMLTEEMISKVYKKTNTLIDKYIKKGFRFGICDYGSGLSEIKVLYELPIEIISISNLVLRDATKLNMAAIALESTLDLAKNLEIGTMVNGISNVGEFEIVAGMNCDYITGSYLFEAVDGRKMVEIAKEKIRLMGGFDIDDSK